MTLPERFQSEVADAAERLARITEEESRRPYREGGWLRKQVLGHLIDSAVNNHNRFVRASLQDSYTGPAYDQEGWMRHLAWHELPWEQILRYWRTYNELLARVVDRIPPAKYATTCHIGAPEGDFSLEGLIDDYLIHLRRHVAQICG